MTTESLFRDVPGTHDGWEPVAHGVIYYLLDPEKYTFKQVTVSIKGGYDPPDTDTETRARIRAIDEVMVSKSLRRLRSDWAGKHEIRRIVCDPRVVESSPGTLTLTIDGVTNVVQYRHDAKVGWIVTKDGVTYPYQSLKMVGGEPEPEPETIKIKILPHDMRAVQSTGKQFYMFTDPQGQRVSFFSHTSDDGFFEYRIPNDPKSRAFQIKVPKPYRATISEITGTGIDGTEFKFTNGVLTDPTPNPAPKPAPHV